MASATEQLRKDHKMIRKILGEIRAPGSELPHVLQTLQRVVLAHAWFEDVIFLPAIQPEPLIHPQFVAEIVQEHKDIASLMDLVRRTPVDTKNDFEFYLWQLRTVLDTHFDKEEDCLFPITERIFDSAALNRLGDEMERRKTEVRNLAGS